ncbi:hypothetical protein C0992_001913 [Termitomyces sp. T32_za158]|nr:hypothetical protein C0992_001913 [Termitomyces sp. T32_za158]
MALMLVKATHASLSVSLQEGNQAPNQPHAPLLIRFYSLSSHSSIQVSPSIAPPRMSGKGMALSPASSYESSPNLTVLHPCTSLSSTGVHELRNPPVDPRRHRRLCSDFGLTRQEARASPIPDISSLASTPLATYTETDSDSDMSFDQLLEHSFPEPPSINETLHLRRMHSSPIFDLGETDQATDVLKKRWGVPIPLFKPITMPLHHLDGDDVDPRSTSNLQGLDMRRSTNDRNHGNNAFRNCYSQQRPPFLSQRLESGSQPLPFSPKAGKDNSWKRATTATILHSGLSDATSISLARSTSSVEVREDSPVKASVGPVVQRRFGSLPLELTQSIDRLDLSIEKLKTHNSQQLPSLGGVAVLEANRKKPEFRMSLSPPSLASAGRKKPEPHPYHPLPRSVAGPMHHPSTSASRKASSDYRATREQPFVPLTTHQSDRSTPKSFMDITPEREEERGPRSRVRKFLARASIGMFSWGKNVSRMKSISK